jgi:hypothetical protein
MGDLGRQGDRFGPQVPRTSKAALHWYKRSRQQDHPELANWHRACLRDGDRAGRIPVEFCGKPLSRVV